MPKETFELEISIRVDSINTVHAHISIFTNQKRYNPIYKTRGHSGSLCIDAALLYDYVRMHLPVLQKFYWEADQEAPPWVEALGPDLLS